MTNNLPSPKSTRRKPQAGRGYSARRGGHNSGRGTKGQKSRAGYSISRPGFEGGQMPLSRRLPYLKGFTRGFATANLKRIVLPLSVVAEAMNDGVVTVESLIEAGFITSFSKKISIKILFDKEISSAIKVEGIPVSKTAAAAIAKAGGEVI